MCSFSSTQTSSSTPPSAFPAPWDKAEGGVLELVWVELKEHMVPQLGWQSQRRHPTYSGGVTSSSLERDRLGNA
jgi:hypothetical protein